MKFIGIFKLSAFGMGLLIGLATTSWSSQALGEEVTESPEPTLNITELKELVERTAETLRPEKTGDPMLDSLLNDWYKFSFESVGQSLDYLRSLSAESAEPKAAPNTETSTIKEQKSP